ncbi:MAG: L-lactate dehydrogenase, partial [Pseudonocardiales bacterium]|nr:L-lactate dehydrogenase [Pseudonocardiales bacterium]
MLAVKTRTAPSGIVGGVASNERSAIKRFTLTATGRGEGHGGTGAAASTVASEVPHPAMPRAPGTAKVVIVGAGRVGTTLAYTCLVRGVGKSIALYGRDPDRVRAEVLDLNHGLQFVPMATIVGSADIEICTGADVVVVTAGANAAPGQSRLEIAEANVGICRELVPRLVEVAPSAIFLF